MSESTLPWCIIGAGPAGLLAARALKRAGIAYEQFEKNPDVGGIWDIRNDGSPMYESAHFISSKQVSHLPGYPMPEDYPDYPNHRQVFAYLQAFAKHYDLLDGIRFDTAVERVERDGEQWVVDIGEGEPRRYAGLFLCSGNTWDPNLPDYPGELSAESFHSVRYRDAHVFEGKRVLVVGGGNSGCDIACDAATYANGALISLRRGYHFIPKYIFGTPTDLFAEGVKLPFWLEKRIFKLLVKGLVGDLTRYGLPKPDHALLESHPIMNTQVLHHLGHGDLAYRPDVARFDGNTVHFTDGSQDQVDLVVFATGYKVTYPYMDKTHFEWIGKYPDLYLSALHRTYDSVCCLGLHQTDGGAFDFFAMQADMMANFILDKRRNPERAQRFSDLKRTDRPALNGGLRYVRSDRHATYVKKSVFKKHCERIFSDFGWQRFASV
ncbi:MAG: NAD(P)-binding domain-containing protein [Proteobacteria bacterium]|nr:NAD(P)-binding domain-containing protein [Pseudomonadota bacterium]